MTVRYRADLAALVLSAVSALAAGPALAIDFSGGVTVVGLHAFDAVPVADEVTASADLFATGRAGAGEWLLYIEGNTAIDERGVSTTFAEVNADAGTALDPDRSGRLQISELNYRFDQSPVGAVTIGLIDPSGYLDRTRLTNDENVQFLGVPFVNNPTIEFPDYTLGVAVQRDRDGAAPEVNVVVAASNGLADNPNVSYGQLIDVDARGRGVFVGIGAGWESAVDLVRLGAWANTQAHESFDGRESADNYGVYAVYGRSMGAHGLSLRAGLANDEVARAAGFTSIAYRYGFHGHALGLGYARTFLSANENAADLDDTSHFEVYLRLALSRGLHVTTSMQRVVHSSFVTDTADPRRNVTVMALRLHYGF